MVAPPGVPQIRSKPRRDTSWQDHAHCIDTDPRIFFDPRRYADALLVCGPCPVKEACRKSRGTADGVWGGKVFDSPKNAASANNRQYMLATTADARQKRLKRERERAAKGSR